MLPYIHILGIVGLRPITVDATEWTGWLSHLQTVIVMCLLMSGYTLEYLSNFR